VDTRIIKTLNDTNISIPRRDEYIFLENNDNKKKQDKYIVSDISHYFTVDNVDKVKDKESVNQVVYVSLIPIK
jgi:hypothetical protein